MKRSRALLLILLCAAGLLFAAVGLKGSLTQLLARHYQSQLDTVPDDQADVLLRRAAGLGQPGIDVLVDALGSKRASVARAAKNNLLEQLGRWELLRASESSLGLAKLADAMAGRIDDFGPAARCDAADLATRILSWPLDRETVDRGQVIASCERVLRSTRLERRMLSAKPKGHRKKKPVPAGSGGRPLVEAKSLLGSGVVDMARLPGGGLPIDTLPTPSAPLVRASGPALSSAQAARQPGGQQTDPPVGPLARVDTSGSSGSAANETRENNTGAAGSSTPSTGTGRSRIAADSSTPKALETRELMRLLRSPDEAEASEARAELVARGFSELELDMARRLFDPDPLVRRQLARALPAIKSVNPAPWLLLLSRDSDADVRLLAITLLGTTTDPAVLEQVEQLARRDSDTRIRRQAERIAGRGRGTLR